MTIDLTRRAALGAGLAATAVFSARRAHAQATKTIRIGILTDFIGPNSASNGKGSVAASRLAAEDFMRAHPDIKVEIRAADYQSKPDVATSIARDWIDRGGVDLISNVNNSAAALAIASLVREKNKAALFTAPASSDLTGKACSPNHIHWTYDTWALGNSTGGAMVKAGGDKWFFIAADYAFGRALARDTASFVTGAGGKVLGTVLHAVPRDDRFLLVHPASAGERGEGGGPCQFRHQYHRLHQAGRRIRAAQERYPPGGTADDDPRRARRRAASRAGPGADGIVLLGPQRR